MFTYPGEIPKGQTPNLRQTGHPQHYLLYHSTLDTLEEEDGELDCGGLDDLD